jgi:hypothetical protein
MFIEMPSNKNPSSSVRSGMVGGKRFAPAHAASNEAWGHWASADTIKMPLLRSCNASRKEGL